MPELLLFANDHSADLSLTAAQRAAAPKLHDLVWWWPDGYSWGDHELSSPAFRLIKWPAVQVSDLQSLMSPLHPLMDSNLQPTTHRQFRGFYLDITHAAWPAELAPWWADTARTAPAFELTRPVAIASVKIARPHVPITA